MLVIAVILIIGGFFSFAYSFVEEKGKQLLLSIAVFILGIFLVIATTDSTPKDYDAIHERYEKRMQFEQDARDFYEFKDAYEKAKSDYLGR